MVSLKDLAVGSMLVMHAVAGALVPRQNVNPGPVSGATFIHDPTVVKTPGGSYIAAFTANGVGLKQSSDRTNWRDVGAAFPNGAPWTEPFTKGDKNLWAPDISFHNGLYYMYYSASSFGSTNSAIFLATSKTGLSGSWTNKGVVVQTNANSGYNAIDGNLVVDQAGKWWLTFGSFWSGIKIISLDPKTGLRSGSSLSTIAARPLSEGGAVEAPFIVYRDGYYYLWVSFDKCCQGAASTYRIMVGRSKSVTGPYLDKNGKDMKNGGGTQMMSSHGSVHGPGHNAVFRDNDGDVLMYHYYNDKGDARMGINLIRYASGWPVIY